MFDIGFWELLLIAVLGLLVLGPERLPRVARTVGLWAGRARGYVRQLSQELDRELQASELKRELDEANTRLRDVQRDVQQNLSKRLDEPQAPADNEPSAGKKPE
ncbi:MAG: Sec-independent protein translocase protein TatB [Salinisphaeraceae bacterium]|nr:Sec-independent protein translocase protein TatB [Salinisphaeraceae bacterium]